MLPIEQRYVGTAESAHLTTHTDGGPASVEYRWNDGARRLSYVSEAEARESLRTMGFA